VISTTTWGERGLLLVFAVVVAIVWGVLQSRAETKRRKALESAAAAAGWDSPQYSEVLGKFQELLGTWGQFANPIVRRDGSCALFDYTFTTNPHGRAMTRWDVVQTVVYVRSDRLALPVMSIKSLKVWGGDWMARNIAFTDAYSIHNPEPSPFEEFPDVDTRRYLMNNPGINIYGARNEIFVFRPNNLATPDQILEFAKWGEGLARMFERPA
jgi:hypothetical protein